MAASVPPDLEAQKITESQVPEEQVVRQEKTVDDEFIVKWDGDDDPENPQNWSTSFKSWVTAQLSMLAFTASLASSIISPANQTIAAYVGVSEDAVVLNVSLYV